MWTGKVADFGLSRATVASASASAGGLGEEEDVEMYYKSARGQFAVRWTAPESMFTEGELIRIQGVELDEVASNFSSGGIADVSFAPPKGSPSTFFVSSETGEIFAYLTAANKTGVHEFNVTLIAEDGSGLEQPILERTMTFRVADFEYYLQPVGTTGQNEEEVMLPPGTPLAIDGIQRYPNGITEVTMHEVMAAPAQPKEQTMGGKGIKRNSAARKGSVYEGFGSDDMDDETRL